MAFTFLSVAASSARAAPSGPALNERLLEFRLKDRTLISEGMLVVESRGRRFFPSEELLRQLGFFVETFPDRGILRAKIFSDSFNFQIEIPKCQLIWQSKASADRAEEGCRDLLAYEGDIFVSETVMTDVLGGTFAVDELKSLLTADFRRKLPVVDLREREQEAQLQNVLRNRAAEDSGQKPGPGNSAGIVEAWQGPKIHQSVEYAFGTGYPASGANLAGDAWAQIHGIDGEYSYSWAAPSSPIQSWRISKQDPDHRLLGSFLGLSRAAAGDVYTPTVDLITNSRKIRGVLISSFDLDANSHGSVRSFSGRGFPDGYVELLQDGVLLESQRTDKLGTYLFTNVILYPGSNSIEFRHFGPQGERKSERHLYLLSADEAGDRRFSFLAMAGRDDLADLSLLNQKTRLGNSFALTSSVSRFVNANATRVVYLQSQLQGNARSVAWDLTGAVNDSGNHASQVQAFAGWERARLQARWQHADGNFVSSALPDLSGDNLRDVYDSSLTVPVWNQPSVGLRLAWQRQRWKSDRYRNVALFSQTISYRNYFLQHDLQYASPDRGWSDALVAERGWGSWSVQASATYAARALQEARGSLDFRSSNLLWTARASAVRGFSTGISTASLAGSHDLGWARLVSSLEGNSQPAWKASLSLEFDFERETHNEALHVSSRNPIIAASLSVHAFADANGNGLQDPGEPSVTGLRILLNKVETEETTDESGDLYLGPLSPFADYRVEVHPLDLMKRNLQTTQKFFAFRNAPGVNRFLNLPLRPVAEVEGYVYVKASPTSKQPARYRGLELKDSATQRIFASRSDREGYFVFDEIPNGRYALSCVEGATRSPLKDIEVGGESGPFLQLGNLSCP